MGLVDEIKQQARKSGANKGKFIYFKPGTKVRIRFLQDFEDGMAIKFHDSFAESINLPCQELFGRECPHCENEALRTRTMYAWSVFDYEAKEVKILLGAVNNASPIPAMVGMFEAYGTVMDRDYVITKNGQGTASSFSVVPLEKVRFRNDKVKAYSKTKLLELLDKAFPDEDAPEAKPAAKKASKAAKPSADESDEWETADEEDNVDYASMSARELYTLCKDRDIEVPTKKPEAFYIKKLEQWDAEQGADDGEDDTW